MVKSDALVGVKIKNQYYRSLGYIKQLLQRLNNLNNKNLQ